MGLLSRFRHWFMMDGHSGPLYQRSTWQPIATAPDGEHILLGWSEGDEEFDYLITAGQLHAGKYDFDVGELRDGIWQGGPEQPTGWVSVGGPSTSAQLNPPRTYRSGLAQN